MLRTVEVQYASTRAVKLNSSRVEAAVMLQNGAKWAQLEVNIHMQLHVTIRANVE